jgi:hypothetical protein
MTNFVYALNLFIKLDEFASDKVFSLSRLSDFLLRAVQWIINLWQAVMPSIYNIAMPFVSIGSIHKYPLAVT